MLKYAWWLSTIGLAMPALHAQTGCEVTRPTASMSVKHVKTPGVLSADPHSPMWQKVKSVWMIKDCSKIIDYPDLKTEIRGFWSNTDLYLLFACPYRSLNLFLPAQNDQPRRGLWNRDVVEMFLGDDWENIRHYREYEIAPTGDWIDLAIDLDHRNQNRDWRSGWTTAARIDEKVKVWYAAAKIPLQSVSTAVVKSGTRWRMNLYRIDGDGPDPQRRFMCWQPLVWSIAILTMCPRISGLSPSPSDRSSKSS